MLGTRCVRLNIRSVLLIVLCFFINGIKYSSTGTLPNALLQKWTRKIHLILFFIFATAINHMEFPTKSEIQKNNTNTDFLTFANPVSWPTCFATLPTNPNDTTQFDTATSRPFSLPSRCGLQESTVSVHQMQFQLFLHLRKGIASYLQCKCCLQCKFWRLFSTCHIFVTTIAIANSQGVREFQRPMICRYCWQTEPWEQQCTLKDSCNSAKQYYMWVNPEPILYIEIHLFISIFLFQIKLFRAIRSFVSG